MGTVRKQTGTAVRVARRAAGPGARATRRAPGCGARARRGAAGPGARWLEVAVRVRAASAERLGTLLIAAGSHGVITGVRELARGPRRQTHEVVRGFFPSSAAAQARLAVRRALRGAGDTAIACARVTWRALDAALWEMDWRRHFRPVHAGRSLVVVPPWDRGTHPGRRRVVIHPGMAFGTGQHATTHTCLEVLERLTDPPPAAALDVGTGSGVLAIALAKLGVRRVDAIDTDPQALAAARDNRRRNGVARHVRLSATPLDARPPRPWRAYPLVVANLYVDALVALAPTLARHVRPGGHLVASGILRTQQGRLRAAFAPPVWRVRRVARRGSWVTTVFTRHPAGPTPSTRARRHGVRG